MSEGIIIDGPPVASDECGDEKDEGTFRLMEIGDKHIDNTETETGDDDDPGVEPELVQPALIEICDDGIKGFVKGIWVFPRVGTPLLHRGRSAGLDAAHSDVVK